MKFSYLQKTYIISVQQNQYANGYTFFKIRLKQAKYWLINYKHGWKFIADQPSTALKNILIKRIRQSFEKEPA